MGIKTKMVRNFRKIITQHLALNQKKENKNFISQHGLIKLVKKKEKFEYSEGRFRSFLKATIVKMWAENKIVRKRNSFRLTLDSLRRFNKTRNSKKTAKISSNKKTSTKKSEKISTK